MLNTGYFAGKTIFITGASRGIGKEIALKCARDGANVVIAAKSAKENGKLAGTIYSAAEEIEKAGGSALPCVVDVRSETDVEKAVNQAVKHYGKIDILINNASAIVQMGTLTLPMKRFDLMHQVNTRGTFMVSQKVIPHMETSDNPHILNISPPLNMHPGWFGMHVGYTMAKYGMSMCVLGMSAELKQRKIAVNALWPRTGIWTAATEMLGGGEEAVKHACRSAEIMADAAYAMLKRDSTKYSGNFAIDDAVLTEEGITDFDRYAMQPGHPLMPDFFLDTPADYARAQKAMLDVQRAPQAGASNPVSGVKKEVEKTFAVLASVINADLVTKIGGCFDFVLTGEDSEWHIDLKNGAGSCGPGRSNEADCTMTMSSGDFVLMFQGKLKPTAAFMSGKLAIKGDMSKALSLEQLMGQMRAKL